MVIDLLIEDTGDGFTANVPSLKGCESWAHTEDEAIEKSIEMVRFYANIQEDTEVTIDMARKSKKKKVYKLIFDK